MSEWEKGQFGTFYKKFLEGLIHASISYAVTGERGYVVHINNFSPKQRFESVKIAQNAVDSFVKKKIKVYVVHNQEDFEGVL